MATQIKGNPTNAANEAVVLDATGKLPAVDGSQLLNVGRKGVTVSSSATDVTLTATSTQTHRVSMTAESLSVVLPNATLMNTQDDLFVIVNDGNFDFYLKDSSGTILFLLRPSESISLALLDASTSAGKWGNPLPLSLVATSPVQTTINTSRPLSTVMLSATTGITTYVQSNVIYAVGFTLSGNTITAGTPITVATGADETYTITSYNSALPSSASSAVFAMRYNNGVSNTNILAPISISGTTLTLGTIVTLSVNASDSCQVSPQLCDLGSFKIGVVWTVYDGTNTTSNFAACTIASNVITKGTTLVLSTLALSNLQVCCTSYTTDKAIVSYTSSITAPYLSSVAVITVSGTTATLQTPLSGIRGYVSNYTRDWEYYDAVSGIATFGFYGGQVYAAQFKISTNTVTYISGFGVPIYGTDIARRLCKFGNKSITSYNSCNIMKCGNFIYNSIPTTATVRLSAYQSATIPVVFSAYAISATKVIIFSGDHMGKLQYHIVSDVS